MKLQRILVQLLVVLSLAPWVWCQSEIPLFPIADVKPGLRGVGRTIFEGDRIEEFQVEILGILRNAVAPKHDLILARLSGGPLEKTGVISGMSGSPVYIDGKLVGAVAIAFPFSKEPLAGITPIKEMLGVVPEEKDQTVAETGMPLEFRLAKSSTGFGESARLLPAQDFGPENFRRFVPAAPSEVSWASLELPLRFGGFSAQAVEPYLPLFRQMGFEPMLGGALSGGESTTPVNSDLAPGSMISLLLVRGDLDLSVDCTVTYRQGNNLYACGHRVLSMGPAEFPFAPAHVLVTVPNLASSFKVDAPGQVVGTIRQDRFDAIYGVVGDKNPPMIPVNVQIQSTLNIQENYKFDIVQEPFLSPLLLNLALISTLNNTERSIGASTMEINGKIRLTGGEAVDLQDVLSGDVGTASWWAQWPPSPSPI